MIRRILMVICLVPTLAFAALWYVNHRRADLFVYREHHPLAVMTYCQQGQLRISIWLSGVKPRTPASKERQFLKFGTKLSINATPLNTVNHLWRLCMPLWLPFGFFLSSFAVMLIRGPIRVIWRRGHNRCLRCGYQLDGLPEPRCPECGCEVERFIEGDQT